MSIRDELLAIKGDKELLEVDSVIATARADQESYPLLAHRLFDKSDAEMAEEHRRTLVRQLISIHIVNAETGYREAISLSVDRVGGGGYRMLDDVLPVQNLREIALADALKDLDRLQQKYNRLHELAEVWAAKETVRKRGRRRGSRESGRERPRPHA